MWFCCLFFKFCFVNLYVELVALLSNTAVPFCRLKPSIDFQFEVNAKGSSPAEILGTTYKTILKPALNALANETKRLIISKRDESIDLQKQLQGIVKMLEEKRSHVSVLQAKNNEVSHLIRYMVYHSMTK